MDDIYFGRQRLAGCNPTVIKLCTEIPPGLVVVFALLLVIALSLVYVVKLLTHACLFL